VPISGLQSRSQCLLQLPVKTFYQAIGLWVVRCSELVIDPQPLTEATPDSRGKLYASIRGYHGWHSKPADPAAEEGLHTVSCCCASQRNGLGPPGTPVHHCEQVGVAQAGGWERPHEVDVYVGESPRRHLNGLDCGVHCCCRLTPGAGLAVSAHLGDLGAHLPPHEPRRYHPLAGSDAWMGDVVDGREYLLPEADRHHWPSGYLGHITSQILSCGWKKFYL